MVDQLPTQRGTTLYMYDPLDESEVDTMQTGFLQSAADSASDSLWLCVTHVFCRTSSKIPSTTITLRSQIKSSGSALNGFEKMVKGLFLGVSF